VLFFCACLLAGAGLLSLLPPAGFNSAVNPAEVQQRLADNPAEAQPAADNPAAEGHQVDYQPSRLTPVDPVKIVSDPQLHARIIKDQVLVALHPKVTEDAFKPVLARLNMPIRIIGRLPALNMLQLEAPADKLQQVRQRLANHPFVAGASLNFVYAPARTFNDPALSHPVGSWALRRIRAPEAWDITTGTATIAIVDSGSKLNHEELIGRIVAPFSYATNSPVMQHPDRFAVFDQNGNRQTDFVSGHGTHVAITAGGTAGNGRGTAGVAPTSRIMPIQVLMAMKMPDGRIKVTGSTATIADGIARAIGHGAAVVNLSLGVDFNGTGLQSQFLGSGNERRRQIERDFRNGAEFRSDADIYRVVMDRAHARGAILVRSAGNDGLSAGFDPMSYSQRVITVAATDQNNHRSIWSPDGRLSSRYGPHTTVSAPGTAIYSGFADPGEPYKMMDGTSMAAPHVAGIIALMKSLKPSLTFEEARDILVATGRPLNTDRPIGPLVDARAALDELRRRMENGDEVPPALPPLIPPMRPPPPWPGNPGLILDGPAPWDDECVQVLIDIWLTFAEPMPQDGIVIEFFDCWGQPVSEDILFKIGPPNLGGRTRYEWIWEKAKIMRSLRHGTLLEFVTVMLKRGNFEAAPAPLYPDGKQQTEQPVEPKIKLPAKQIELPGDKIAKPNLGLPAQPELNVTRFTFTSDENGVVIGIIGTMADGKVVVASITIQDGGRPRRFNRVGEVPVEYRPRLNRMIEEVVRRRVGGRAPLP
jgi:subtilisin family serine protease